MVRPEMEMVTEGDRDLKTLCLNVNNSAIDVTVGFPDSLVQQLIGNQANLSIAFSESSSIRSDTQVSSKSPLCLQEMLSQSEHTTMYYYQLTGLQCVYR